MSMKSSLWMFYALVLLAGAFYLRWRESPLPKIHAATALPAGHLLSTGNVLLPEGPHYLRRSIKAGDLIEPRDLVGFPAELPVIATPKGTVPLMFKVDGSGPAPILVAGKSARICGATKTSKGPVRVVSVLCGDNDGNCLAVAAVPGEWVPAIAALERQPILSAKPCREPN